MKVQLKRYLDNPEGFMNGFALYVQLGGGPELPELKRLSEKRFISKTEKEKLLTALTKIYHRLPDVETIPTIIAHQEKQVAQAEPLIVTELRVKGRQLKKRESFTHALLVNEADKADNQERLFQLAKEIMEEIQPELDQIYGQIKAYEKDGTLPPTQVDKIKAEVIQEYKQMKNMQNRVYRLRNWLKGELSAEDRDKYELELKDKEPKLQQLKERLSS